MVILTSKEFLKMVKEEQLMHLVSQTYKKFGINFKNGPRFGSDEAKFRFACMCEELDEFYESKERHDQLDAIIDLLYFVYGTVERQFGPVEFNARTTNPDVSYKRRIENWYSNQTLRNLEIVAGIVFDLQNKLGFSDEIMDTAFRRVNAANAAKELGPLTKRGSFELDLVKPEGWTAPDLRDLV